MGGDLSEEEETIATCDAVTAFRQSDKFGPEEIDKYVGYKQHKDSGLRVFKLLGSLYGMVDASMRWFETITPYLKEVGFIQGSNDKCIFYNPNTKVRIALHVDDYLCRGPRAQLEDFFEGLREAFEHKEPKYIEEHIEEGLYFVGVRISQTIEEGVKWYHMDQKRDIEEFISDMGCSQCRPVSAPMAHKELMHSDDTLLDKAEHHRYRSAVGSMQYFVSNTQWHLAHTLARL